MVGLGKTLDEQPGVRKSAYQLWVTNEEVKAVVGVEKPVEKE